MVRVEAGGEAVVALISLLQRTITTIRISLSGVEEVPVTLRTVLRPIILNKSLRLSLLQQLKQRRMKLVLHLLNSTSNSLSESPGATSKPQLWLSRKIRRQKSASSSLISRWKSRRM